MAFAMESGSRPHAGTKLMSFPERTNCKEDTWKCSLVSGAFT